jgi:hypothetical protein
MMINSKPPIPGLRLLPGSHLIDGVQVTVPDGVRLTDGTVFFPLLVGKHFVDEKIVIIPNPAHVIQVPIGRGRW